ncbi:BgTH12-02407 [Blumeria graminis f. sp. triticale]|nr:BgTH12-02407 [Blumeria graminis f. sp. triticale]
MEFKKTLSFLEWLPKVGIKMCQGIKIDEFLPDRGRGIVAIRDFSDGEIILTIPRSALLNSETAGKLLDPSTIGSLSNMPEWLNLTALILAEAQNTNSRWGPYLSILPEKLDSLIFWSQDELSELQASAVVHKIEKESSEKLFSEHIMPLGLSNVNYYLCHLIASIIMAYAFDVPAMQSEDDDDGENDTDMLVSDDEKEESTLSMVPLADLFNADADKCNVRLFCDKEDLEMRTVRPILSGEELFNDYGALPQTDLLRRYGYITENYARYNVVEIFSRTLISLFTNQSASELPESLSLNPMNEKYLNERIALAVRENIFEESYDIYHSFIDEPSIPEQLIALVYILLLQKRHFMAIESSLETLPGRSKLCTGLVGQVLVVAFKKRETEYATSLAMDEEIIKSSGLSRRMHMAVTVRLGEKRILQEAIQEASTFCASNKRMINND